jgi:hypothetical protein
VSLGRSAVLLVAAAALVAVVVVPRVRAAAQAPPGLPNPQGDFGGDGITNEIECSGTQSNFLLNGSFETPDSPTTR